MPARKKAAETKPTFSDKGTKYLQVSIIDCTILKGGTSTTVADNTVGKIQVADGVDPEDEIETLADYLDEAMRSYIAGNPNLQINNTLGVEPKKTKGRAK